MTYNIVVHNDANHPLDISRLTEAIKVSFQDQDVDPDAEIGIVLTTDKVVREMNYRYRGIDQVTDVLSFPADRLPVDISDEPAYLGDIVIAYDYTFEQAKRKGHAITDSFVLLVVHGVLHLLGYDHDSSTNRAEMWSAQERLLRLLSVPVEIVPALAGDEPIEQA